MPKNNKQTGGKSSKSSNQLLIKNNDNNERYAEALKPLGNCQFMVRFLNGDERVANIKGSMTRSRGFDKITTGNYVLVQLDQSTTSKEKFYIIHRYSDAEKKTLEKLGELVVVCIKVDKLTYMFEGDEETIEKVEEKIDDSFINDI